MIQGKQILKISGYIALAVVLLVSLGFAAHKQSIMPCSGVNIIIRDTNRVEFINEKELLQSINDKFGSLEGKPIRSINISLLEKIVNNNPFIYNAEVFSTIDGKLNIEVNQRIPILRVINYKNESFYIDKEGTFIPQSEKYSARVPVASGFIFNREVEQGLRKEDMNTTDTSSVVSIIAQLYNIIRFVNKSEFWNAEVQQLYVNVNGDIEFIPSVGNHSIILGDDTNLDEKFRNLLLFYKKGLGTNGWNKYKAINVKYKNQVVCIKK
jgi:cell division protein FtsQ